MNKPRSAEEKQFREQQKFDPHIALRCSATHKSDSMEAGSRLRSCRYIQIIRHKREMKEADDLEKKKIGMTSFGLHVLAMVFMLLDHLWATILTDQHWMTNVGRLAFPIFAFLIAEGYFRTRNVKKYMGRLFVFALISEIPFNLMTGGGWVYPYHQNVLWTFLIAILCMIGIDKTKSSSRNIAVKVILILLIVLGGWIAGTITFVDYYGFGVLTVLTFYAFHKKRWWDYLAQIIILYYINVELLGGLYFQVNIFGVTLEIVQQGLALLALPIIWLYNGERGYHKKWWQYFCYAFYPLHMLVLYLVFLLYVMLY